MCSKMVINIIKTHRSFNDIFMIRKFFNQFIFIFIVFIMYLTDNLLQNIFQSNESCHFTVLVKNNGNIESGFTHLYKKFGNVFVLICEMRFAEKTADIKSFIGIIEKEILHINDSDDIILCVLVNRQTGKTVFAENIDQFFISRIYIGKCDVDTWNHDVFCIGIPEIKHIVDHFFLIRFDDTVLMTDINNRTKLFFGHGFIGCIRIHSQKLHKDS